MPCISAFRAGDALLYRKALAALRSFAADHRPRIGKRGDFIFFPAVWALEQHVDLLSRFNLPV